MSIHVELSLADVNCLVSHLPVGSDLRYILLNSVTILSSGLPVGHSNPSDCNEGVARALLRIAIEHCSEAVEKIQYGMNVAGVRHS